MEIAGYSVSAVRLDEDQATTKKVIGLASDAFFDGAGHRAPEACVEAFAASRTRAALAEAPQPTGLDVPVVPYAAGCLSAMGELTLGENSTVPVVVCEGMIVRPAHRRKGLMRGLMCESLAWAHSEGAVAAALTASNTELYGRFGYGPATSWAQMKIDTSPGWRLRRQPRGQVVEVGLEDAADHHERLYAKTRLSRIGSMTRTRLHFRPANWSFTSWDSDDAQRCFLHLSETGEVDGYARFRVKEADGKGTIQLNDIVALDANAEVALVDALAAIELTEEVSTAMLPVDSTLPLWLTDPRRVKLRSLSDHAWVRILDVPRFLQARQWWGEGDLVIEVSDPLDTLPQVGSIEGAPACPSQTGTYRLHVADEVARVERVDDATSDLRLSIDDLAGLAMGNVNATRLASAGRAHGDVSLADALFATPYLPQAAAWF